MGDLKVEEYAALDFGRDDAETDTRLLEYFYRTGHAAAVQSGKVLVLGRKGSGKTALFKHLEDELGDHAIPLDLDGYVFAAHRALVEQGIQSEYAFRMSWRLLVICAKYAKQRKRLGLLRRWRGDRALRSISRGPNGQPFHQMVDWLSRVRGLKLPFALGGIDLSEAKNGAVNATTLRALDELEAIVNDAELSFPTTVLIDRLDDAWNGAEDALRLIAGAVQAARDIRIKSPRTGCAPVVVFLRSDLWDPQHLNDQNKHAQDTVLLEWSDKELLALVDLRIHKTAGVPLGEGWEVLFTREEMRQRAKAETHVLKRCMGRPRDIVAFARLALEASRESSGTRIQKSEIYEAERRHSRHMLEELKDELGRHVTDFTVVVSALKNLRRRSFSPPEWAAAWNAAGGSVGEMDRVLDLLFEASAVGVPEAGGAGGGSRTTYRYKDRHLSRSGATRMQVHNGLIRELGLTDR